MNDSAPIRELNDSAKRLMRYRLPLVLAILVNCVLVARIPYTQFMAAKKADASNETTEVALAPTETPSDSVTVTAPTNDSAPQTATTDERLPTVEPAADARESDTAVNPMALAFQFASNEQVRQTVRNLAGKTQEMFQFSAPQPNWEPVTDALNDVTIDEFTDWDPHLTDIEPTVFPPIVTEGQVVSHVEQLVFHNPWENGGPVQFLLDSDLHILNPGETLEWTSAEECRIRYHRGDSFGNAEQWLAGGSYQFSVTDDGWELSPVQ